MADSAEPIVSEAVADTASTTSDNLSFLTDASTIGNSIFSVLRRSRSVAEYVRDVCATPLEAVGADIATMPRVMIKGMSLVPEQWLFTSTVRKSWIGH